ncbi:MAG: exonuclease domain-containing protein [Candidatus Omnitrophica bacterium]|nr:exonuclease domain-containing protein [Candidatus Omnitrophota bacterium]
MKLSKPLVVLDLETTGTWVEKDRIVEIGMVKLDPSGARQDYIKRINPGIHIPANVTLIINITDEDVKNAPRFKDVAKEVLEFIGDADLGGFNIQRFDLPVLEREFYDTGLSFHWKDRDIYDAQKIYHIHEKRDLMAAYFMYCGKELQNAHSALSDAEATAEILKAQIQKYGSEAEGIESLKDFDYESKSYYFDKERKFCWWNGQLYPSFGKYRRKKHIKDIAREDREYLVWILGKDFNEEVLTMVRKALDGEFPQPPAEAHEDGEK